MNKLYYDFFQKKRSFAFSLKASFKLNTCLFIAITLSIFTLSPAKGQYVRIGAGASFSSFKNKIGLPVLDNRITNPLFVLGADYLNKSNYFLSSEVGFLKIGGSHLQPSLTDPSYYTYKEALNYVSLNTTINYEKRESLVGLSIGLGPYANFLLGNRHFSDNFLAGYEISPVHWGIKIDGGVNFYIKNFKASLKPSYHFSLSPSAKSEFISLVNNPLSIVVSLGYALNKTSK